MLLSLVLAVQAARDAQLVVGILPGLVARPVVVLGLGDLVVELVPRPVGVAVGHPVDKVGRQRCETAGPAPFWRRPYWVFYGVFYGVYWFFY
jgi:hypothetical protein